MALNPLNPKPTFETLPGETLMISVNLPRIAPDADHVAKATTVMEFDKVKHLLSNKPLRSHPFQKPLS